ncbi:MAG: VWA domain-containing protein [Pseudobdellovibrio sp.]
MDLIIKWAQPSAFYLLILVVLFAGAYLFFETQSQLKLDKVFGERVARYLAQSVSLKKRRLQIGLQCLGLIFLILALARPQAGKSQQEVKSEGIELLILADVSESMMSEDVKPSRLAQVKIELAKLLELMPGNKIGIIAFAGSSSLLSPLTTDPNALRMYIDSLDIDSVSTQGTNFEVALSYAKEAFEKGGVTQDSSTQTTRAILVVSDGEDQEPGALDAAKALSKDGIRIFTMAYGTEKGGAIPEKDNYGNMTGYKKDNSGQTVLTQVRGDFLKSLADAGGGQFYFATFNGDHLRQFVNDLGHLEKTQFQSSFMTQYEEKYTLPLSIGLFFLVISFFISDRQSVTRDWIGKYEVHH